MYFDRPNPLGKAVEVKATNRPIKIAYLVPYQETQNNHWIIDAVFFESYTRWGGARTLIIPTDNNGFIFKEYDNWLFYYDPDFIYSYVDIDKALIEKLDAYCPVALLKYKPYNDITRWRDYLPDWHNYFKPVSSITTIHSPHTDYRRLPMPIEEAKKVIITQYHSMEGERFVPDNFGTEVNLHNHIYPNPVFDTYCLVPKELPEHMYAGTQRLFTVAQVMSEITSKKAITISMLAMAHSESIPQLQPYNWSQRFNLFVGECCLDRIHFWNARNFSSAFRMKKSILMDNDFIDKLGQYFNQHNFLGQQGGPPKVALRSYSHSKDELEDIREKLNKYTHNQIVVTDEYNNPAIPSHRDDFNYYHDPIPDVTIFKVREDINEIRASEPRHFSFIPARFSGSYSYQGQWAVELMIERHHNYSKYSNISDKWELPLRNNVVRAFTRRLGRVSRNHQLVVLPTSDDHFSFKQVESQYFYDIVLLEDDSFFGWLLSENSQLSHDDLRNCLTYESYKGQKISDKGQNLRGVISMFDNISEIYGCLTNRFWREVLRERQSEIIYSYNKLKAFLPNDLTFKKELQEKMHFKKIGEVQKYLVANLKDTLEFLVNKKVFYQIHQWRCPYCGHSNIRTIDALKNENHCEICTEKYFTPIDIEWKYKLNDFVHRSLCERNGLSVLWVIGHLHGSIWRRSFFYIPEVNLYNESRNIKNYDEIDILCVLGGKFYAVEVKLSAIGFVDKPEEIAKFIKKIKLIRPDVALLAFEQYCENRDELESTKQRLRKIIKEISGNLRETIKVETVVACDLNGFNDYPVDIGYTGDRTISARS